MPYGSHIHLQENSMATDLGQIQRELEEEIRQLELEKAGYDARLEEKRRLLSRLRVDEAPPQPEPVPVVEAPAQPAPVAVAASSGRVSITDLGKHHYEADGKRFKNAGHLLDYFDVPHYFSQKHPKKGDAAAREILRWTRRSPELASKVDVVLADGSRMNLDAAVNSIWPDA